MYFLEQPNEDHDHEDREDDYWPWNDTDEEEEANTDMPDLEEGAQDEFQGDGRASASPSTPMPTVSDELPNEPPSHSSHVHHPHTPAKKKKKSSTDHSTKSHTPPSAPSARAIWGDERGHYVCLNSADDIRAQLPRFKKEYNTADDDGDSAAIQMAAPPMPNANGAPMTFNTFMNTLGVVLGLPGQGPPPGHPGPPPPAANGNGGGNSGG